MGPILFDSQVSLSMDLVLRDLHGLITPTTLDVSRDRMIWFAAVGNIG